MVDRAGRIETANATFADLVDLSLDQIMDHSVFDPPWSVFDEAGTQLSPEQTPAVMALRTGRAVHQQLLQVRHGTRSGTPTDSAWLQVSAEPIRDATGGTDGTVLTLTDVTELRRMEQRLTDVGRVDVLTGLATRAHVVDTLDAQLRAAGERPGRRVGVLHVDLDNFRSVNDTFGAVVGDVVLRSISERLADLTDRHVAIGRIGVDEFLVVVSGDGPSVAFDARLGRLAEEIQRRTEQLLTIEGLELRITASIGVSRWPGDGEDSAGLQRGGGPGAHRRPTRRSTPAEVLRTVARRTHPDRAGAGQGPAPRRCPAGPRGALPADHRPAHR